MTCRLCLLLVWLLAVPAAAQEAETPPEEPTPQEPTPEEPTPEEPAPQEPALEEPTPQEPTLEEPALEEDPIEVESPEDVDWTEEAPRAAYPPLEPAAPPSPSEPRQRWTEAPADASEPEPGAEVWSAGERRAPLDYSGRGEPPRDPADDLLWIPRILLSPFYLISEYVLRRPIGWLVSEIERSHFLEAFFDFFTWEERNAGLVPTAFFDFGFSPSAGLYLWWNNVGAEGNQVRVTAALWGADWLHATVTDRLLIDDDNEITFRAEGLRRPDHLWNGGGWDARHDRSSRFGWSRVGGGASYTNRPWRASEIRYSAQVQYNVFEDSDFASAGLGTPIEQAAEQGWYDLPPGYTDGYFAFSHRLQASLDTREERPAPGHGVRIQGWLEHGLDLTRAEELQWLRYGGQAGAFVDLGSQRVLQLIGSVDLADPLGSLDEVPFTEQIWMSTQPLSLSGFPPGEIVGRSAVAASLEYHYPIWVWLEGSIHYSVGNAFDGRFTDFDFERLRQSFGFGFRTIGDRDNSALVMIALGTEPFVRGAGVTSVRFVIGTQDGF